MLVSVEHVCFSCYNIDLCCGCISRSQSCCYNEWSLLWFMWFCMCRGKKARNVELTAMTPYYEPAVNSSQQFNAMWSVLDFILQFWIYFVNVFNHTYATLMEGLLLWDQRYDALCCCELSCLPVFNLLLTIDSWDISGLRLTIQLYVVVCWLVGEISYW
jgi:hypothetical protein